MGEGGEGKEIEKEKGRMGDVGASKEVKKWQTTRTMSCIYLNAKPNKTQRSFGY